MNDFVSVLSFRYVMKNYKNIVSVSKGLNDFLINRNYNDSKLIRFFDKIIEEEPNEIDFKFIESIIDFVKDREIIDIYLSKIIAMCRRKMIHYDDKEYINKRYKIIKFLVNNIVNTYKYASNLIGFASDHNYLDLIELLIEKGVNICEYKHGFRHAVHAKHFDIAKIFVEKIPTICSEFISLVIYEANYNHIETIKFLIDNGIDINLFNNPEVKKVIKQHNGLEDKIVDFYINKENKSYPCLVDN